MWLSKPKMSKQGMFSLNFFLIQRNNNMLKVLLDSRLEAVDVDATKTCYFWRHRCLKDSVIIISAIFIFSYTGDCAEDPIHSQSESRTDVYINLDLITARLQNGLFVYSAFLFEVLVVNKPAFMWTAVRVDTVWFDMNKQWSKQHFRFEDEKFASFSHSEVNREWVL